MSENFIESRADCGNGAALVSYLYGECEPRERDAMAAHLATCPACAAELQALDDTRRMLPAWSPPEAALGFRVSSDAASPSPVLRPARWWQRPLPGWAQAAAALLIFVAGLSAGRTRDAVAPTPDADGRTVAGDADRAPAAVDPQTADAGAAPAARTTPAVSREELVRLERDLRDEIARIAQTQRTADAERQRASLRLPAPATTENVATLEQVEALIAASESRQRNQLILGMGDVVAYVEERQIRALTPVREAVQGLGREAELNRGSVSALVNAVSAQGGFRLVGGK